MFKEYVKLARVHQWVKDVFIFAPLIFSLNFYKPEYLWRVFLMFAAFCLATSVVYIINDILDRKQDRLHPQKKHRPIASGKVSLRHACISAAIFFAGAVGLTAVLGWKSLVVVLTYICLGIVYSLVLKNIVFIDVITIASGFLLRVTAGAVAIGVDLSGWMLLTTFFLALFLGFGKRRSEKVAARVPIRHRPVLKYYSLELLNSLVVITASLTIITYSLYVMISQNMARFGNQRFIFTIPFVVFGVFRYLYLLYKKDGEEDPAEIVLKDKILLIDIGIWIIVVVALLLYVLFLA